MNIFLCHYQAMINTHQGIARMTGCLKTLLDIAKKITVFMVWKKLYMKTYHRQTLILQPTMTLCETKRLVSFWFVVLLARAKPIPQSTQQSQQSNMAIILV